MFDPAGFFLLDQIIRQTDLVIKILVDIELAYIVEQVEVKVIRLTFFQLLLKYLFYMVKIRNIISRELVSKVIAVPVILRKRFGYRLSLLPP